MPAVRATLSHLAQLGYCEKTIRERLGLADINDLLWRALPIYRRERLSNRDALASAIDLFLLQGVIPLQEVNALFCQTFGQTDWQVLAQIGVVTVEAGFVRAQVSLFPVGDRLVFSEHAWPKLPHPGTVDVPHNQVMFVGSDSHWLARSTFRYPVRNALDLCTGSGIHALLAATHAQRVVAVDINPRAALCTQFNAKIEGIANLTILVGYLLEPVGEERFDLLTANPPFVPSPVHSLGFRDGGHSGEDVQRRIVAALPHHLAPGGVAQIITEIGEREGESIADRVREWLGGAPMDIHLLRLREYSTAAYAFGHADGEDYGVFLRSVDQWHENLMAQGYARIIAVLLTIQWSDPTYGAPWTKSEESKPPVSDRAAVEIEDRLAAERLSRHPGLYRILEQSTVERVARISIIDAGVLGDESHPKTNAQLLGRALAIQQWIEPIEREILLRMKVSQTFAEILTLSHTLGLDEGMTLTVIRSLLQRGLIALTSAKNGIG